MKRQSKAPLGRVLAMFLVVIAAGCDGILGIERLEIGCPDGCVNQTCVKGVCVGDCDAGRKECDEKTPQVCDDQGQWQRGAACEYACFAGSCDCDPGQGRCAENNMLETCDAARTWKKAPCVERTCFANLQTHIAVCTGECSPGKRCLGNTPQVCNALGNWEDQTPCSTGEQCSGGVCACGNGDVRCYENTLQVCTESSWLDKLGGPCMNQACDVVKLACIGECAPNAKQCDLDGKTPQTCNESGEWVNEAACSVGCAGGKCVECADGTPQCNGQQPQACVNGQWQDKGNACDQQTCNDGACVGECAPGGRCLGNTPQVCNALGQWEGSTPCKPGEVCNGGSCTCVNGDLRCYANTPQQCVGAQWQDIQGPCENTNQTCDAATVACVGVCAPGKRCSGTTLQACDALGQWQDEQTCGNSCLGDHCTECAQGAVQCVGNTPQECSGQGQWQDVTTGACVERTCNAGVCVGVCAPGGKRCAGDRTQTCDVNGQWVDAQACVSPQHCSGGDCVVECSTGDLRCFGNTPQTCDATGAWADNGVCLQQTCVNGFCVGVCGPSGVGCNGLFPQSCDANGEWKDYPACTGPGGCVSGSCPGASCVGVASNCGPGQNENCCLSPVVSGGTYDRSNDGAYPATVSDFRLDRFEITVGRFRKFVEAYPGSKPASGAGAHPLIAGSGWNSAWDGNLPADQTALKMAVKCSSLDQTWTDAAGANENLPMNCLSWFEAFAFCAWDGGRLPTEAEWNYAAAGGNEQRLYPWGKASPDATYAVYDCLGNGNGSDCVFQYILTSGSKSPKGDGKWGQADIGGSMWEWNLDWYQSPYMSICKNCANILNGSVRVVRGGSWYDFAPSLLSSFRFFYAPGYHGNDIGARCARTP